MSTTDSKSAAKEVCRAFRNNDGNCRFGTDCKYEHSKGDKIAVPERDYKPKGDCHNWEKEKTCKFGDRCRFLHGQEDKRETYRVKRDPPANGEQEICRQYERRGRCRWGDKCKHKHVEGAKKEKKEASKSESKKSAGGDNAEKSDNPRRRQRRRGGEGKGASETKAAPQKAEYDKEGVELCRRFKDGGKCKFGSECTYSHNAADPKAQPKPGQEKPQRKAREPRAAKEVGECYDFAENGHCEYGDECRFKHGGSDKRQLKTRERRAPGPCYSWQENGTCEYGD